MRPRIIGLLSWALSLGLDVLAVLAFTGRGLAVGHGVAEALAWHGLALAAVAGAGWAWADAARHGSRWVLPALCVGFCAPAPGAGHAVALAIGWVSCSQPAGREEPDYCFGDTDALTEIIPDDTPRSPQSVLAILRGRDIDLRRRSILALRAVDSRRAVPVLQKGIQDSDEQVRLLSQTLLHQVAHRLEFRLKAREAELATGVALPARLIELAELYHELVFLGLSSEETEVIYLDRAVALLDQALRDAPGDPGALRLLLRCHLRREESAPAWKCLADLRAAGVAPEALVPWEAELLFLDRDWLRLRSVLSQGRAEFTTDNRFRRVVDFCLHPELTSQETRS
jgi:hypothetical protein